jgi:DNA-binding response OmpR family regulator
VEKVLLIDDNVNLWPMLTRILEERFPCTTALRGDTGMLKAQQEHWALVLLAVMLPGFWRIS